MSYDLIQEIREIKKNKNIALLAHYYEEGQIQDLADAVGDSYYLALQGRSLPQPNILLAGVVFMAESVKLLSPEKRVFVPDMGAGCSLVAGSPYEEYLNWKNKFENPILVTYINSSIEIKSISDVIVTSSNAKKIISQLPKGRPILFGPDQNLGRYLAKQTGREMVLWEGECEVHVLFSAKKLSQMRNEYPEAVLIAHPECDEEVLAQAHVIGSTSRLLEEVKLNPAKQFIVATEEGILHQMKKARPDALILQAPSRQENCHCNQCPYMKLNTLQKIKNAMLSFEPEIQINSKWKEGARASLEKMVELAGN